MPRDWLRRYSAPLCAHKGDAAALLKYEGSVGRIRAREKVLRTVYSLKVRGSLGAVIAKWVNTSFQIV